MEVTALPNFGDGQTLFIDRRGSGSGEGVFRRWSEKYMHRSYQDFSGSAGSPPSLSSLLC